MSLLEEAFTEVPHGPKLTSSAAPYSQDARGKNKEIHLSILYL